MDDRTLALFMSKVEVQPNGCWYWTGHVMKDGYGTFYVASARKTFLAHRVSFTHFAGPIPDSLELDHLCHTRDLECPGGKTDPHRRCVNWADLEPVTGLQNWSRGRHFMVAKAAQTHCIYDHEYTADNTYTDPNGHRQCRTCRADAAKEWLRIHHPGTRHGTETHCPQDHPYSGPNLIVTSNGGRACRECKRAWNREYMRQKRAAAKKAAVA
jgi:hypothetical protein